MDRHAVRPDEIGAAYDRIAERWSADDFPRDNGIAAHRRAIAFLTDRRTALDIGSAIRGSTSIMRTSASGRFPEATT